MSNIEVTPQMIRAGVDVLFREYGSCFDALEGDADDFVLRIFTSMAEARPQSLGRASAVGESPT